MLNEAYTRVEYQLEREGFDNVPALIRYYVGNRKPVSQVDSSHVNHFYGNSFFDIVDLLVVIKTGLFAILTFLW